MKTKFASYKINGIPDGCKYCIKGEKLVLFISGICSRNCYYCSLSNKRKNKDTIWANERICKTTKNLIKEIKESNAKGMGITGGDPLLFLSRTIKFAKAAKNFKKNFHIHIYLPTKLVSSRNIKRLSKYIDEIRFHPEFLINNSKDIDNDIEKIKLANKFFKKKNIGIELPMIPEKKHEILNFIKKISPFISFVNLNELELSETNFNVITKKYDFTSSGYVIKNSKNAGIDLLKKLKKQNTNLKIHFCTADTKNFYQYENRLKKHNILPFGKRTKEGTVIYLTTSILPRKGKYYFDKQKNRYNLSEPLARKLLGKIKILRVEEFPTFDRIEVETEYL